MTFSLGSTPRSLVKYNDQSISAITEIATSAKDAMVLIKTITADGSGTTVTFDSDIDSTYPIYLFKIIQAHPNSNDVGMQVGFRDGSTAYDASKTTTSWRAYHDEGDTAASLAYYTAIDHQNTTGFQYLTGGTGNDNDQCLPGELWLFNPSSTTFVKHFIYRGSDQQADDAAYDLNIAGYCNTTSAIDGVQFQFNSGNLDAGTFKMYGIKDS